MESTSSGTFWRQGQFAVLPAFVARSRTRSPKRAGPLNEPVCRFEVLIGVEQERAMPEHREGHDDRHDT